MRIEFITEEDFYVLPFFEEFFRRYSSEFEVVQVSCCRLMGRRGRRRLIGDLILLYGTTGFARLAARHAMSLVMSRFPRDRNAPRYHSIRQLCRSYQVACARTDNPNSDQFVRDVKERGADLLISVACPYILKSALLEAPPKGCINLHNAPLPRYKGMMPTFWQMFHGEKSLGLTIHYMTERIDNGGILFQDEMEINLSDTLDALIRQSKERAAHCLGRVLRGLETGAVEAVPMPAEKGSYFTFPDREKIREFHRRGLRAI